MIDIPHDSEVWSVALGAAVGHDANKTRPCLVVSADRFNAFGLVTVCPITSRRRDDTSFVAVLDATRAGLDVVSYVQSEQVRTVSVDRLSDRLGAVAPGVLTAMRRNIKRHLLTP